MQDDADISMDETEATETLNTLEEQEKSLQNSLIARQAQIMKVIGKMKNSTELKEARARKVEEGKAIFARLQNAEREATLNANTPLVPTGTSESMVARGKARYGSGK
jgi:hypothetical protein